MSWKEQPHLFANGKFKISTSEYTGIENDTWDLVGVIGGDIMLERGEVDQRNYTFEHEQMNPDDCKLIARPISDMADKEDQIWTYKKRGQVIRGQDDPIFHETPESFLYLLSIGCYPFDQNDFKSGDVIDITTLKEEV